MNRNILFLNTLQKFSLVAGALVLAGCASIPDASTSTQPAAECRIAPVSTASFAGKKKTADRMDQIKALNDFARFESNARHLSPAMQVQFEEMLRECGR